MQAGLQAAQATAIAAVVPAQAAAAQAEAELLQARKERGDAAAAINAARNEVCVPHVSPPHSESPPIPRTAAPSRSGSPPDGTWLKRRASRRGL